jgi:tellurite resistance protein TerC
MLPWIAVCGFVLVALAVDLRGARHGPPSMRRAIAWSVVWTLLGLGFALALLAVDGSRAASEYLAGFLIERSLSLDNLFVFAVLFSFFAVPAEQRLRVLIFGVAAAIALRGLFIVAGAAALDAFAATTYVLGALLALTAVKIARHGGDDVDPQHTLAMRALRRVVPLTDEHHGERLVVRAGGRRVGTPLLAALVMVAAFDVMFAIDSIPAIFAITRDTFVVFAANAFSLLGMISLYFVLDGMLARFRYLNVGLALILGYVAAKLLLADVWHPPIGVSLAVIAVSLGGAALASVLAERSHLPLAARD